MTIETATYIGDLNSSNPDGLDQKLEGDNHARLIKSTLQNTFPGLIGRMGRVQQKSGTYNLAATDNLTVIECTASFTLGTAASIAALGNGFQVIVRAASGNVTFDPNAAEEVNSAGVTSVVIPSGQWAIVVAGPTRWLCLVN